MANSNSWFRGLRGKLLFSALLPIVGFTAITVIGLKSVDKIGGMLQGVYTDVIPNIDALGQLSMQRARIGYFIWAGLGTKDLPKSRTTFIEKTESAFEALKKAQVYYEKSPFAPEEEKTYAPIRAHKARFYELTTEIIGLLKVGTPEVDEKIRVTMNGGEWHILATEVQKMVEENTKYYQKVADENNKQQAEDRKTVAQLLLLISIGSGLAVFGILMWIAYKVSTSVGNIASLLADSGSQVSSAITQLTQAGMTLSQSSTEAAASLEETVASLEEMSSMVKMNSDNAKQAAALSASSKEAAEDGQKEIHTLIGSMQDISKSSKQIEEIISVIDDIAFQTNLLALNASVEAARAGEQGKGFAVVAEAVRTLAQRSAVAAKDITVLIKESVEKVDRGSTIADRSGAVLNNIVTSVKKVSDLNNEISAASSEQTTGIQQISKAMNQLDQSTQANAASSEEIASSSEEISAQADQMRKLTVDLNAVILGGEGSAEVDGGVAEVAAARVSKAPTKAVPFKAQSKVVPMRKPVSQSVPLAAKKTAASAEMIPFDEDEGSRKVGTTDGF
jgi:hypothetical protein